MPDDFGRYAKREYERRWLLRALPDVLDANRPTSLITNHYLDGTRFRVRRLIRVADGKTVWKLTQKFPESAGAIDRVVITNTYLTQGEYDAFHRLPGRALVKRRWLLHLGDDDGGGGDRYGVDVFDGPLTGLITAEREYPMYDALRAAAPPSFDGIDVTHRVEFTGGDLAGKCFADLADLVDATRRR